LLKYGAVLASLLLAALLASRLFSRSQEPGYSRASVGRGNIVKTISATGRLQPVVTVQIERGPAIPARTAGGGPRFPRSRAEAGMENRA
jgi:hypothetical protein